MTNVFNKSNHTFLLLMFCFNIMQLSMQIKTYHSGQLTNSHFSWDTWLTYSVPVTRMHTYASD